MHRALLISEVVREVCELLSFDRLLSPRGNASALAALARSSRALSEPALDMLWSCLGPELPGMRELLRCMPSDLWENKNTREFVRTYYATFVLREDDEDEDDEDDEDDNEDGNAEDLYFVRPICPWDWDRFFFYARRVRKICDIRLPPTTADDFMSAFVAQHPGDSLFPNLRYVDYYNYHTWRLPLLSVLGPKSRVIHISTVIELHEDDSIILRPIANTCTSLVDLQVFCGKPLKCFSTFNDIIQAACRLKYLCIPWIWFPVMATSIAKHSCLETLDVVTPDEVGAEGVIERFVSSSWPPSPFRSLSTLQFTMACLAQFSLAMQAIPTIHLAVSSLEITSEKPILPDEMGKAVRIIAQCFDPTSLRELEIRRNPYFWGAEDGDTAKDGALFTPLLSFVNLEGVTLACEGLRIDDTLLKSMVDEWRNLESLSIFSTSFNGNHALTQCITLTGLSHLAQSCSSLLDLHCHVDLRDIQLLTDGGELDVSKYSHNQVEELVFAEPSFLSDDKNVASVLSTLFPQLQYVSVKNNRVKRVCKVIQAFLNTESSTTTV